MAESDETSASDATITSAQDLQGLISGLDGELRSFMEQDAPSPVDQGAIYGPGADDVRAEIQGFLSTHLEPWLAELNEYPGAAETSATNTQQGGAI